MRVEILIKRQDFDPYRYTQVNCKKNFRFSLAKSEIFVFFAAEHELAIIKH